MKHKFVIFMLMIACTLSGCSQTQSETDSQSETNRTIPAQPDYLSETETQDCYVCGKRDDRLIPYYAVRDSIGIIHWNKHSVSDTEVRAYDDNGNELFGQDGSSTKINSFGDGYGSVVIRGTPNRGFTNVSAYYSAEDEVDLDAMEEILCQSCLDKVAAFYSDQQEYGDIEHLGTTGYCLIDFQTKELYTLSDPYRGYFIRDYYVTFDITEGENSHIDLLIFYAPEREK